MLPSTRINESFPEATSSWGPTQPNSSFSQSPALYIYVLDCRLGLGLPITMLWNDIPFAFGNGTTFVIIYPTFLSSPSFVLLNKWGISEIVQTRSYHYYFLGTISFVFNNHILLIITMDVDIQCIESHFEPFKKWTHYSFNI